MARGITSQPTNPEEKIQVLSTAPNKEIDFSQGPAGVAATPEERASMPLDTVAPIVRDATAVQPPRIPGQAQPAQQAASGEDKPAPAPAPKDRLYRVEVTKQFVDRTSGARTILREGKEISSRHYNIRDLQQQGMRLKDITDVPLDQAL